MACYLAAQVADESHREVTGPLLPASGASGLVLHDGQVAAQWGDPDVAEMCFSVTKSVVAMVAGVAHDDGVLDVRAPVAETVELPELDTVAARSITWEHLLHQTSSWDGELWGKPTRVDAQSAGEGSEGTQARGRAPGSSWAYNDVRVNLACLALTVLLGRALPDVLQERLLGPLGGSSTWSWHGYADSVVSMGGVDVPVVSGGAHWGGGLWMSARDLALLGQLCLDGGQAGGRRLLSREWIARSWRPCPVKAEYGYLWWRNDTRRVFPQAPASGRCARGNGGRHLLWVDPARGLVIASHWGDGVEQLLAGVSAAVLPVG